MEMKGKRERRKEMNRLDQIKDRFRRGFSLTNCEDERWLISEVERLNMVLSEAEKRYNQMVDEIRGILRRESYAGIVTEHDLYKLEAMLPPDAGEDEGKGITKANLLSQMKINIFSKSRSIEDDKSSADAGGEEGK